MTGTNYTYKLYFMAENIAQQKVVTGENVLFVELYFLIEKKQLLQKKLNVESYIYDLKLV